MVLIKACVLMFFAFGFVGKVWHFILFSISNMTLTQTDAQFFMQLNIKYLMYLGQLNNTLDINRT